MKVALTMLLACALQQQALADNDPRANRDLISQARPANGCPEIDRQGYPSGRTVPVGTLQPYHSSCTICKANGEWSYVENSRCGMDDSPRRNSQETSRRDSSGRSRSSSGGGLR